LLPGDPEILSLPGDKWQETEGGLLMEVLLTQNMLVKFKFC